MRFELLYFEEVENDIQLAKIWYKNENDGLEIDFSNAIEKAITHILDFPKVYPIRYKKTRIAHPKVFPYNIHFYIDDSNKSVVITAIIHNKRRAQKIKKRGLK